MSKSIEKFSLFLIKPDGTEHGEINHNSLEIFLSGINEISSLSFKIPERIISNVGVIETNPYYTIIKPSFRVRLEIDNEDKGTYIREFKISKPSESSDGNKTDIKYTAYSREVELNQKTIISFAGVSVNVNNSTGIVIENDGSVTYNEISAQDHISYVLDGLTIADISLTLLANMDSSWELDYVDPALQDVYRSNIDIRGTQGLNALRDLQYTYDAVVVFDTVNKKVKYYKIDSLGEDLGWTIEYGKYLKSISKEERVEDIVTRMRAVGANDIGIEGETYIGQNYVEDYTYFLGSFERDLSKVVITSSEWMSDDLAGAILDYEELIATKESSLDALIIQRDGLIEDRINKENEISFLEIGEDVTEEVVSVFHTSTVSVINLSKSSRIISDVGGIGTVDASIAGEYGVVSYQKTPNGEVVEDVTGSNYRYPVDIISGNNYPAYGSQAIYVLKSVYPDGTTFRLNYTTFGLNQIIDSKNAYEAWLLSSTISDAQKIITEQIITALKAVEATRVTEVATAEAELVVIQSDLDAVNALLDVIYDEISIDNNFTESEQLEWENFIVEGVYQNTEVTDTKLLLSATQDELENAKLPELNIDTDIINILQTEDARVDWDKINLFDFVNVRFERIGIDIQARILEIRISPDTYGLKLFMSTTTNYIRDSLHLQQRALEKSIQASNDIDYRIEEWNTSEDSASTLNDFREVGILGEDIEVKAANDDSVIIDGNGMTISEKVLVDDDYNPIVNATDPANDQRYSDRFVRIANGGIFLSTDGGKTFNIAISAGEVHANVIKGNLLVGNELLITGNDGSNDILEIGNIDTTGNSIDDDFGIMIDGIVDGNAVKMIMARDNGFKIQVNGDDRFSVDSNGKIVGRELIILDEDDNEIMSSSEYSQIFSYSQPIKTVLATNDTVEIIVVFPASMTFINETTFSVSFNTAVSSSVSGDINLNRFLFPITGFDKSSSSTADSNGNAILEFELSILDNFFLLNSMAVSRSFVLTFENTGVNSIDLLDISVSMRMKSDYGAV